MATGLITAGAAIGAVLLTHKFTLWRENRAAEKKSSSHSNLSLLNWYFCWNSLLSPALMLQLILVS
ncbi:hypothetical protein ACJPR0_003977 [Cronobacter sakazakii]|uniref:hypothetical protein n=1 Tax=Cronobacter TaxID=413496 RepID=UPI001F262119|nr:MULTISPECIES: hypothetical protein [Cronobacter]MDK1176010.1 hypothetical protein [Cronobacter malonaticus]MDK1688042.1 hypothetical protein [Cronobacter malonaticus]